MNCTAQRIGTNPAPVAEHRRHTRPVAIFTALTALLLLTATSPRPADASTLYTISGRGFGHGVGMSQYGAYGYAKRAGWTFRQILAHYYASTNVSNVANVQVRVLVRDGTSRTALKSAERLTLYDEATRRRKSLAAGHILSFRADSGRLRVGDLTAGTIVGTYAGPLRISPGSAPIKMVSSNSNGQACLAYRGLFRLRIRNGSVRTVNHLPLESYVPGVVPCEMPSSWHMEALKAQAVAARSFAVARRRSSGDFDLYATTASQYYGARSAETRTTNRAVAATLGLVLRYGHTVIPAYFHASSGGMTENVENVWGGSALPWARGAVDQYDTISPYHSWRPIRYWPSRLDARLGSYVRGTLRGANVTATGVSPRAKWVRIRGSRGTTYVRGSAFRSRLGLRSTWFSVRAMTITAGARIVLYGRSFALAGRASPPPSANSHGDRFIALRTRRPGSRRWAVTPQETANDGRFYRTVKPAANAYYQTALGWAVSPTALVRVRVLVSLNASTYTARVGQRMRLGGGVLPNHSGNEVRVNYYSAGRWHLYARDKLNSQSRYSVAFTPAKKGTYYFATTFASHADHAGSSSAVRTIVVR